MADDIESTENSPENAVIETYLIFTVREKRYALPSKFINEVAALEKIFPLPLVPGYVRGIINRYSVPYALIDINFLLLNETSNARKVIVLKEEVDKLALLIDDVTDIADLPSGELMKIDQEGNAQTALVSAFFDWKDDSVFCLDTGELIGRIRQDFERQDA